MAEFYHMMGLLLAVLGAVFFAAAIAMSIAFGFHRPLVKAVKELAEKGRKEKKKAKKVRREEKRTEKKEEEEEEERDMVSPSSDLSEEGPEQDLLAPESSSFVIIEEVMLVHDNPEDYKK